MSSAMRIDSVEPLMAGFPLHEDAGGISYGRDMVGEFGEFWRSKVELVEAAPAQNLSDRKDGARRLKCDSSIS